MDNDSEIPESPSEEATETPDQEAGEGSQDNVMLSADLLGGIKVKDGDRLTFCVKGPADSEGNVTGYFEADSGNQAQNKSDSDAWDAETVRNLTSPRSGEEETQ